MCLYILSLQYYNLLLLETNTTNQCFIRRYSIRYPLPVIALYMRHFTFTPCLYQNTSDPVRFPTPCYVTTRIIPHNTPIYFLLSSYQNLVVYRSSVEIAPGHVQFFPHQLSLQNKNKGSCKYPWGTDTKPIVFFLFLTFVDFLSSSYSLLSAFVIFLTAIVDTRGFEN